MFPIYFIPNFLKPYIQDQLHIELCMNIFELVIQTKPPPQKNIRSQFIFGIKCIPLRSNVAYPFQNSLYLRFITFVEALRLKLVLKISKLRVPLGAVVDLLGLHPLKSDRQKILLRILTCLLIFCRISLLHQLLHSRFIF
jgi:hypothetical protein